MLSVERLELEKKLEPWRNSDSPGKKRVKRVGSPFTIKYKNTFLISRTMTDAELFFSPPLSDVLESGTRLDHLVFQKNYPCLRKPLVVLLDSRIGF